jgi:hypothetical protein
MNIVRQWVAAVVGAYLLGVAGWCLTEGLRNDRESFEVVIGRTLFFTLLAGLLFGGVAGLVWYSLRQSVRPTKKTQRDELARDGDRP